MPDDEKNDLSSAALDTAVREIASMVVLFAVSYAVMHRDEVARLWALLTSRPVPASEARAMRLLAEFRAAVSRWEHGEAGN